jgi:hypothetical protein
MPWIPDFFAQELMASIRYQDITPEERARKPQPVAVTLVYGWGKEQQQNPMAHKMPDMVKRKNLE